MFLGHLRRIIVVGMGLFVTHALASASFSETLDQEAGDKTLKQEYKYPLKNVKVSEIIQKKEAQIFRFEEELKALNAATPKAAKKPVDQPLIVGGKEISETEYPAVGAIIYDGKVHCTGTLIGYKTVLTAAHCVDGYDMKKLVFATGNNANNPKKKYSIADGKVHYKYTKKPLGTNDIALLYLNAPTDGSLSPISIAKELKEEAFKTANLEFVGYGYSDVYQSATLGIKRKVSMKIAKVTPTTLEYRVDGRNTCTGDSGGPAFISNTVVGVTAWGDLLCLDNGVNMRVDAYSSWITSNLK